MTPKSDDKKSRRQDHRRRSRCREAERERIEKQNRIKQDEYNDKVKAGQDRVKELNARFADWYYVVSDETYRKIHLGEDQIVKKKAPEKAADATLPANPFPPAKSLPAAPRVRRRHQPRSNRPIDQFTARNYRLTLRTF